MMTEKQVLLKMRKNIKEKKISVCININCSNCCYFAGKEILEKAEYEGKDFCLRPFGRIIKDLEELYIEKFGYESLIEELL